MHQPDLYYLGMAVYSPLSSDLLVTVWPPCPGYQTVLGLLSPGTNRLHSPRSPASWQEDVAWIPVLAPGTSLSGTGKA